MDSRPSASPNIVLLVIDGVRASDAPGGGHPSTELPSLNRLRSESIIFPNAVTVSPWSLPAHESLFTGLYPWEHGVHSKGRLRAVSDKEPVATTLKSRGYSTLSLSGNAFVSPETNLTNGFDYARTAKWWEPYIRSFDPSGAVQVRPSADPHSGAESSANSLWRRFQTWTPDLLLRFPFIVDGFNRIARRVKETSSRPYSTSPWIESSLDSWLGQQPGSRPVFAFINLMEAHDPYLSDPELVRGYQAWWRTMSVSQQRADFFLGRWGTGEEQFVILHDLYKRSIQWLDRRIGRIVEILRSHDRWDDTWFVLTSDHGNAFGEGGTMFHGYSVDESVTRIPLWLRLPWADKSGIKGVGWASLIDVYSTLLEAAGTPPPHRTRGRSLTKLITSQRPDEVVAVSEGLADREGAASWYPRPVLDRLDRVQVAVYKNDVKLVFSTPPPETSIYALGDTLHPTLVGREDSVYSNDMEEVARFVALRMNSYAERKRISETESMEVIRGLRSWGYL